MPTNLDALIRYHTIDQCLQNRGRKWTLEDLADACFEKLNELRERSSKVTVGRRTIQQDITILKGDVLGYNAPIERKGKKIYILTQIILFVMLH